MNRILHQLISDIQLSFQMTVGGYGSYRRWNDYQNLFALTLEEVFCGYLMIKQVYSQKGISLGISEASVVVKVQRSFIFRGAHELTAIKDVVLSYKQIEALL